MVPTRGFPEMAGFWQGETRYFDAAGNPGPVKQLTVDCRIVGETMSIINTFTETGVEPLVARVRGTFDDQGRFHIDSERAEGIAWESDGLILASWHSKVDASLHFWELAVIVGGRYRTRTWHHLRDGALEGVTIFEERKTRSA